MSRGAHRITKLLNWSCASLHAHTVQRILDPPVSQIQCNGSANHSTTFAPKRKRRRRRQSRNFSTMFLPQVIFATAAIITGSIIEAEAGESGIRNLLQLRHVADNKLDNRRLQGAPQHPDLSNIVTTGGKFSADVTFYQQGNQYIRLYQNDCTTKFAPDVEFSADSKDSFNSEWSGIGGRNEVVPFEIPLKNFLNHIAEDNGTVDVCVQLETDNTLTNIQYKVNLDLTHESGAFSVDVKQPDALMAGVTVDTQLTAWVCDGSDDSPVSTNNIEILEVPGKIYICIEVSGGYAIQSGKLVADAARTQGDDYSIVDYMDMNALEAGVTGEYNAADTCQEISPNLVRVSFMGDSNWATLSDSGTLTITVDAYFEPERRRHLASPRRVVSDSYEEEEKKFQPGRLRIRGDGQDDKTSGSFFHEGVQFSSFTTSVQLKGPADETRSSTTVMGCAIGAGILAFVCCFYFILARKLRPDNKENNNKAAVYPDVKSIVSSTAASTSASSISSIDNRLVSGSGRAPGPSIKAMRDPAHTREARPSIKSGRKSNGSAPPRNVLPRYNGTTSRNVAPRDNNVPPRKVSPRSSKVPSRNVPPRGKY